MKKRLLIALAVAVVLAGVTFRLAVRQRSIGAKFTRIHDGMTEAEVTALLGGPAQDSYSLDPPSDLLEPEVTTEREVLGHMRGAAQRPSPAVRCKGWRGDHWIINVWFDRDRRVVDKDGFVSRETTRRGFLRRLAARFGW